MKKKRLRWKKQPRLTGLRSVSAGPQGYDYHDGEKVYATVYPIGGGWRQPLCGWYWVAGWDSDVPHYNSCNEPVDTPEEAKKQAEAYVRRCLSEPGSEAETVTNKCGDTLTNKHS